MACHPVPKTGKAHAAASVRFAPSPPRVGGVMGNILASNPKAPGSSPGRPAVRLPEWKWTGLQSRHPAFDSRIGLQRP